jgi:hypothetical protein
MPAGLRRNLKALEFGLIVPAGPLANGWSP